MSAVSYTEWLEALKVSASTMLESGVSDNSMVEYMAKAKPAIRLVEFFEKIAVNGTEVSMETENGIGNQPKAK